MLTPLITFGQRGHVHEKELIVGRKEQNAKAGDRFHKVRGNQNATIESVAEPLKEAS